MTDEKQTHKNHIMRLVENNYAFLLITDEYISTLTLTANFDYITVYGIWQNCKA